MQFQVPQFIEVEDKIFGPLTFRQFIYLAGGLGGAYVLYRVLPIFIAAPIILAVGGFAASLAFLQFNGRPFIQSVESGFYFFMHPRLYLWNNNRKTTVVKAKVVEPTLSRDAALYMPKLSESKLHELSWSLDIQERISGGIGDDQERHVRERPDALATVRTARDALA